MGVGVGVRRSSIGAFAAEFEWLGITCCDCRRFFLLKHNFHRSSHFLRTLSQPPGRSSPRRTVCCISGSFPSPACPAAPSFSPRLSMREMSENGAAPNPWPRMHTLFMTTPPPQLEISPTVCAHTQTHTHTRTQHTSDVEPETYDEGETAVWYNALFGREWTDDSVSSSSQKLLDDLRPTAGLFLSKFLASFEFKCVRILSLLCLSLPLPPPSLSLSE